MAEVVEELEVVVGGVVAAGPPPPRLSKPPPSAADEEVVAAAVDVEVAATLCRGGGVFRVLGLRACGFLCYSSGRSACGRSSRV